MSLKTYIVELRARLDIYIPVKGDAVDKALALFINNYRESYKMKVLTNRVQAGVYDFGTKKVHMELL